MASWGVVFGSRDSAGWGHGEKDHGKGHEKSSHHQIPCPFISSSKDICQVMILFSTVGNALPPAWTDSPVGKDAQLGLQICSAAFLLGLVLWALLVSKGHWILNEEVRWAPTHALGEAKPGLDQLRTDHWAGTVVYEPTVAWPAFGTRPDSEGSCYHCFPSCWENF